MIKVKVLSWHVTGEADGNLKKTTVRGSWFPVQAEI
jgi:hypothetical protein